MNKFPEYNLPITVLARHVQDPDRAEYIARSWAMSNDEKMELVYICRFVGENWGLDEIKRMIAIGKLTEQNAVNILAAEDRWSDYSELRQWERPAFPLNGNMLMDELNIQPGPVLGSKLAAARAAWALSDFKLTADQLIEVIK